MLVPLVAGSSWRRTPGASLPFFFDQPRTYSVLIPARLARVTMLCALPPLLLSHSCSHIPVPLGSQRFTGALRVVFFATALACFGVAATRCAGADLVSGATAKSLGSRVGSGPATEATEVVAICGRGEST